TINYVVKAKPVAPKISSFTTNKTSPQIVGTQIGLTAKATGEGTLQYRFRVGDGNGNYSTIRNYSTSNTATWNANYVGNKILCVDVKDSNGKVTTKTINYVVKAKSVAPKITSFTTNKTSPQVKGTAIILTAKATGEGTLQYRFRVGNSSGNYSTIKNYSTSNTVTWNANYLGNKILYVDVKDSNGKVVTKSLNYVIKSPIKLTGKVVEADGDTDYTNNKVLSNATVKITKNGVTQTTKTNANGVYYFEKLMDGAYTITVSKDGYKTSTQTVNIPEGQANYYNSTIELISNASVANGTASGTIYDVLTGNGVKGLTLKIRSGIGNTTGNVLKTIKTGEDGKYSVTLPAGNYCVQIIDERTISNESGRYLTNTFDIKILGNKTIGSQDGNVSTAISSQQIRIVLKWGENPKDLDSHLVGPTSSGEKFHIYFWNKRYEENSKKIADLDLDDTSSYGPETTTIYNPVKGKYQFYVFDYSDRQFNQSSALANSGAVVQVYIGASNKPLYTFNVPQQEGTLWKVFEYDSVTKKITPINKMSYERYSGDIGMN
ncbi:MAG: carboxypeptidase regulatory-like domain-containing protein, partial [Clostridium sp.]|nr:carboxypeptidase regulatory-like domain-containing protein [Clostridium sp.]